MNNEEQLQEIEVSIEDATKAVDLMKSLEKLSNNPDFKKVMLDGYFKEECVRLVLVKAEYEMRSEDIQNQLLKDIDAIGRTRAYLHNIMLRGQTMVRSLASDKETKEELLSEQAE